MPKIYKPNKVTMSPNNMTIDPSISNTFSFIFNGESLSSYILTVYDLFTGQDILTTTTAVSPEAHNGDVISKVLTSSFFSSYQNMQMSYDVSVFGSPFTLTTTISSAVLTITGANYGYGERVFLYSATPLGEQLIFLVPMSTPDQYYGYMTLEAARNGLVGDRIVAIATSSSVVEANIVSEQVPFRTSRVPTLTITPATATNANIDIIPTYTHPDGYALNRFTVYLYDSLENLLFQTTEIFSSYAHYQFKNLSNGESYKVRFTGYSVLDQFVDTGKVAMLVTYQYIPTTQNFSLVATNDCVNGRVNLAIGASPALMPIVYEGVITQFGVTNILIYRQKLGDTNFEIIARIPASTTLYHDYMAQASVQYRYKIGFDGYVLTSSTPPYWTVNTYLVVPNSVITSYLAVDYYGWFLVDLDSDVSYAFDANFEGGDLVQEDNYTKYTTNLTYNAYSVGNIQALSSNNTGLISVSNLHGDFSNTNTILTNIANLVSSKNTNRKIVKDRRTPTRIYPVFTHDYREMPLNPGIGQQPYLCSFAWDQVSDKIE